jgi:hypothetical protein
MTGLAASYHRAGPVCSPGYYLFIWRQLEYKYPIVELRVLKNTNLRIGIILTSVIGFGCS